MTAFLNHLALERKVAAGTQNHKEVLHCELPWLENMHRVTRPARVPTVLTRREVAELLAQMEGTRWLIASLLYGAGCAFWSAYVCA